MKKQRGTYKKWFKPREERQYEEYKQLSSEYTRALYYRFPLEKRKDLKEKQFFGFLKTFYGKIADEIVNNNWIYKLGRGCGKLQVIKRESYTSIKPFDENGEVNLKGKTVHWNKTETLWNERPHTRNKIFIYWDTEFSYYLYWDKRKSKLINSGLYSFSMGVNFAKKLNKALEAGQDYFTKEKIIV